MFVGVTRVIHRTDRRFSTAIHILLATTVACGGGKRDAGGASAGAATRGEFKVALLTPGAISDQSWNGGAYQGLLRIRDSLGAKVSHIQTKTPAEFDENFRQYGTQGYAIVFGHGFEFQDAAARVAPEYPRTVYVVTSGNTVGPNLAGIEFGFDGPSYLAGIIAGSMSKSGVVATIGGTELPPVRTSFEAFAAGARAANPTVKVLTAYIGNWDDAGAAKEQALAQIARGADVLFQNADAAGLGVFQAAREHPGVYVVGSNSNQNGVAPDVTLGSVAINLPHAFLTVAREVKDGRFKPRVITLGMNDDVVTFILNPALQARIPPKALALMEEMKKQIAAGTLKPGTSGADSVK